MWYNSKQSGIVGQARKLELSNFPLTDGDPTYTAVYWCSAKNSDGTGRSQNVTVYIVSKGKTINLCVFVAAITSAEMTSIYLKNYSIASETMTE